MENLPVELIDFAEYMADEARKISRLYYRSQTAVHTKEDNSPVTEADRRIEDTLAKLVANNFPDHGIFGEEFGYNSGSSEYLWLIDPIDGTKSFISGRPIFGTLISLVKKGTPILGIIDQPINSERWVGVNGITRFNNTQVNTRTGVSLAKSVVAATTPFCSQDIGRAAIRTLHDMAGVTVFGGDCYSYGQLAMGQVDIVIEASLKPYDFCALIPIIENAGGVITDWEGKRLDVTSNSNVLACGDPVLHRQLLSTIF